MESNTQGDTTHEWKSGMKVESLSHKNECAPAPKEKKKIDMKNSLPKEMATDKSPVEILGEKCANLTLGMEAE
nr:hypothetical protein Iba_scaffold34779CG0010 [Ipomoea batatas]